MSAPTTAGNSVTIATASVATATNGIWQFAEPTRFPPPRARRFARAEIGEYPRPQIPVVGNGNL